ncbi:cyclophilin-like fold protein [Sutterella sp.]|uniref:cyclophilin-like fold protein n=1 Tax=Sutterella sp. TaxID=1981025 RepID=UPI0026E0C207|nr:cyclophilin-like fold protein [Sutterella sp.]MDO5532821.1 cyclophilin-like fold protein [Sutterella sp.]
MRSTFLKKCVLVTALLTIGGGAMAAEIFLTTGGVTHAVTIEDHDAAKSLIAMLPLDLKFEDYGSVERISYLPRKLTLGNAPTRTTPAAGDLTYYAPWGNLAVFIGSFRTSDGLVPLGKLSREALDAVRSSGDHTVRLTAARP